MCTPQLDRSEMFTELYREEIESDTTERLNNNNKTYKVCIMLILLKTSLNLILLSAYELFFLWPPFVALVYVLCTLYGRHWFLFLYCSSFTKVPEMSGSRVFQTLPSTCAWSVTPSLHSHCSHSGPDHRHLSPRLLW